MKPIFGAAWADAVPAAAAPTMSASDAARIKPRMNTPELEELSDFEMEFPPGGGTTVDVQSVQTIPQVYAYRSERAHQGRAEPERAEQSSGIELTRAVPHISALEERIQVQPLAHAKTELGSTRKESISERFPLHPASAFGELVEAGRGDGELLVPAKLLAVLGSTECERLAVEERARIAEHRTSACRQAEHEGHWRGAKRCDTDAADRGIRAQLGRVPLERSSSAERSAVELGIEGLRAALCGKRQTESRIMSRGESECRAEAVVAAILHRAQQPLTAIRNTFATIRHENAAVERIRNRESNLHLTAGPDRAAKISDGVT